MSNYLSISQADFTKKYSEIQALQEQVAGDIKKAQEYMEIYNIRQKNM